MAGAADDGAALKFSQELVHLKDDRTGSELGIGCKVTRTVTLKNNLERSVRAQLVVRDTQLGPGLLQVIGPRGRFDLLNDQTIKVRFTYETQHHGDQSMFIDASFDSFSRPAASLEVFARPEPAMLEGPEEVDFGAVPTGAMSLRQVTLSLPRLPQGQGPCKVNVAFLGQSGDSSFLVERAMSGKLHTLMPGRKLTFRVMFRPMGADESERLAILRFASNAFDGEKQVVLSGRAVRR